MRGNQRHKTRLEICPASARDGPSDSSRSACSGIRHCPAFKPGRRQRSATRPENFFSVEKIKPQHKTRPSFARKEVFAVWTVCEKYIRKWPGPRLIEDKHRLRTATFLERFSCQAASDQLTLPLSQWVALGVSNRWRNGQYCVIITGRSGGLRHLRHEDAGRVAGACVAGNSQRPLVNPKLARCPDRRCNSQVSTGYHDWHVRTRSR